MGLTIEQMRHVAMLARLGLSDAELAALSGELTGILGYIDKLSELDTDAIPPTAQVSGLSDVWRDDVPGPSLGTEVALRNAPDRDGAFFRVKAMQE